jgi:hypothetical protein
LLHRKEERGMAGCARQQQGGHMTNDERERLKRRLEVLDDRLVTSMHKLLTGDVDALDLFGCRIILDPTRVNRVELPSSKEEP